MLLAGSGPVRSQAAWRSAASARRRPAVLGGTSPPALPARSMLVFCTHRGEECVMGVSCELWTLLSNLVTHPQLAGGLPQAPMELRVDVLASADCQGGRAGMAQLGQLLG